MLVFFLPGCGANSGVDRLARSYIRLAAALAERDPDSLDYYYGPAAWVAAAHDHPPPAGEIQSRALDLIKQIEALPQTARTRFLAGQLRAIAARAELLKGIRRPFDEEARATFGLPPASPYDRRKAGEIHAELDRLLPGRGALADRYAEFDRQFLIPDSRLERVIDRALQGCRERTLAHVTLPQGESIRIEYVRNKPWDGYSYYQGSFHSRIEINADFPLTVDRALQLVCHESYPGHHVFNSLIEEQLVRREHRLEWMVEPTFSPQSLLSEALATNAADMVFSTGGRLQFERDVLFPIAGVDAHDADRYLRVNRLIGELDLVLPEVARAYLNGTIEFERAAEAFKEQAIMSHAEATLKYLNEYRTYMLTYTVGKAMARKCLDQASDRWQEFRRLITGESTLSGCGS